MASEAIKKLRIPYSELPPISSITEGYSLRYRIISSDKNRISHWSPIYNIDPDYTFVTGSTLNHNNSNDINNVVWGQVSITKSGTTMSVAKQYDVWLKWNKNTDGTSGDWIYQQRTETNSIVLQTPSTYTINGVVINAKPNRLRVEIYIPGTPIKRVPFLLVYDNNGTPFSV